jgi:asparagine synthase (glutamine-hydrolysing)
MKDVIAFNVSVPGYAALDESKYAKQVTDSLGIELMTLPMQAETFRTNLPRAIYYSDLPLTHPNSIAFLLISEFARQQGVKILLSGEGADELFGGYMHRYRRYRQFLRAQKVLKLLPAKVRKAIMLAGYACDNVPMTTFSEFDGLMSHAIGFLDRFSREDLRLRSVEAYAFVGNEPERAVLGAMLSDITNFLAPLLRRLDRMSMAASLECRVPFLDHRLTRTVMNLPLSYRLRGATDKWMLKEIASRHLPNNIVYRKKVGFPLPLGDYIGPLAKADLFRNGFCTEVLNLHQKPMMESVANWKHNVNGFYNLLALEIWGRMYFLKQTAEEVTEQIEELSGAAAPARVTGTRNPTAVSA